MKKLLLIATIATLTSCSAPTNLYTWSKYEASSYNFLKNTNETTTNKLSEEYQKIIKKQKGIRGAVPPGVYADYGFLLLQTNNMVQAKEMLQKEIELYPESKIFIDKIIKLTE
jgi:hypothetical protein